MMMEPKASTHCRICGEPLGDKRLIAFLTNSAETEIEITGICLRPHSAAEFAASGVARSKEEAPLEPYGRHDGPMAGSITPDLLKSLTEDRGEYRLVPWEDCKIGVPMAAIEKSLSWIAKLGPSERPPTRANAERAVALNWLKVKGETATQRELVDFMEDVGILFAFDVFEGKAVLRQN
jgi:hypothetical protein